MHGPPRPCRRSRSAASCHAARQGGARTFFGDDDFALYRDLLGRHPAARRGWRCGPGCLMPNHVHLILVPSDRDGLRRALAPVHRRYAGIVHARRKRTGHFWQGRFGAAAMDEDHLRRVALRVAQSGPGAPRRPRAGLAWSSVRAQLWAATTDHGVRGGAQRFPDFAAFLADEEPDRDMIERLRRAKSIGRPLGIVDLSRPSSAPPAAFSGRQARPEAKRSS